MTHRPRWLGAGLAVALLDAVLGLAAAPPPAAELPALRYTNEFFPGTRYRAAVPSPESILGFPVGEKASTAAAIESCLQAWTRATPERSRLVTYAQSHEGRSLHYVVVTSPTNLARLEDIQTRLARLGDPRHSTAAEAAEWTHQLPAVAWLGFTIHGDETEGSDAALALLYHLIAAEDPAVDRLLERLVVIIDPLMNPDGRDRFVKMIAEHRGRSPNVDDQSLIHDGYWPGGRGNHYLSDLNRDWIWGVHPESRGRVREVSRWNPQLFVDAHGMGSQSTHLFSPPREPINPNIPPGRGDWGAVFARDQATAFDRQSWLYYTGEWNEEWYPGFSDAWASYRGAVGILYEQAVIAEDGVRRPEGRILSYREAVHHHVVGALANLTTLRTQVPALLDYYYQSRRRAVAPDGPYAHRTFAILPTRNLARIQDLQEWLQWSGIEVFRATHSFAVTGAVDQLGREWASTNLPAGTLLVPNRQPLGHLVAAMLEFDPCLSPKALADERDELLRKGDSRIYDSTAWNLTMMYGLEAVTLPTDLPAPVELCPPPSPPRDPGDPNPVSALAYGFDGADDRAVAVAARLMEQGIQVRATDKPCRLDDRDFARGSVFVLTLDNRDSRGDWRAVVARTAAELRLGLVPVVSGFGPGDWPEMGGRHFRRLEPPRVALLSRGGFSAADFGATWYVLDHELAIRHSHIDLAEHVDWSRYNVVIVPDGRSASMTTNQLESLKEWVRAGGTLIAVGSSTAFLTAEKANVSRVRSLPEVLSRLQDYELSILRECQARAAILPAATQVWAHVATPGLVTYPWRVTDGNYPDEKELRRRDAWQALFMPQGALLASRVDTNHWLTAGCGDWLPVLVGQQPVLMSAEPVESPVRYGYLTFSTHRTASPRAPAAPGSAGDVASEKDVPADTQADKKKEVPRIGWCVLPPAAEMHLRMSGLLWPEATHRLANAAWITREPLGRGQVILCATPPTFRAVARGTTRVFLNAVVYGPGFGARPPIRL